MATQTRADRHARSEAQRATSAHGLEPRSLTKPVARRAIRAAVVSLTAGGLIGTLIAAVPAAADPADTDSSSTSTSQSTSLPVQPTNAAEAKQAWLDAATASEAANEALLVAQEEEIAARQAAADAKIDLARAKLDADNAAADAVQSAANYASFRDELAQFASASFRGARLGQLSALLTAESSSDYLDEVSSLDQVAGRTRLLMDQALKAKEESEASAAKAADAQAAAVAASEAADNALVAAEAATVKVTDQKTKLDAQVTTYHRLFSALSGQERAAAMAAQQAAWEAQSLAAAELARSNGDAASPGPAPEAPAAQALAADGAAADAVATDVASPKAQIVIEAALSKLGLPYVYGAAGPNAYDCSGLTSWAWAQAGVTLPRTSSGQASLPVVPLDQLQPGDLITYYSPVHHVALYIGNGQIIHASTEGKPVFITNMYRGGPYPVGHRVNY